MGSSQTIQEAIACVDCFLGILTSLLPGLLCQDCLMDISAEDMRELLLWQELHGAQDFPLS